jgi:hypothetical protein
VKKTAGVKKEMVDVRKLLRQLESLPVKELGLSLIIIADRINQLKGYEMIQISVKRPKKPANTKKTSKSAMKKKGRVRK